MASYFEILNSIKNELSCGGIPEADADAWLLFEYVTGIDRAGFFLHGHDEMPSGLEKKLGDLVTERLKRIPVQFLIGTCNFCGLDFKVSKDTLIPRFDTEVLAELVIKEAKGKDVLDLCTGTGCIIISVSRLGGAAFAAGTDISEGALLTARENAETLGANVEFYCGDLFDALKEKNRKYDIIVSNPPYIKSADIESLAPEVKDNEPLTALDGDEDGLEFYRRISFEAPGHLKPGGKIFYEIGCDQAEDVENILRENGFTDIKTVKDLAGLDRVVHAVYR
ncbi:MAG: peptide chain release factor N(5)-glutamine methyltransferase [Lachnospiraceae bacterium]|nr:peptide chain release factor N(5)-glutamine methyltransferase [Lachnospiraceae bacterium]